MSSFKWKSLVTILVASTLACACEDQRMSPSEIEETIKNNLSKGDSAEAIQKFLDSKEWPYDYDRFSGRFQARLPNSAEEQDDHGKWGYQIYIYVNSDKSFKNVEVEKVHRRPPVK